MRLIEIISEINGNRRNINQIDKYEAIYRMVDIAVIDYFCKVSPNIIRPCAKVFVCKDNSFFRIGKCKVPGEFDESVEEMVSKIREHLANEGISEDYIAVELLSEYTMLLYVFS